MSGISIKGRVSRAVNLAFSVYAELLKRATFKKIIAYAPDPFTGANVNVYGTAGVTYLPLSFSSRDADGVSVIFGDEKWLVKAADLAAISPLPSSGDWFEIGGNRYDVRAAILDPTENLWTFQIRRVVPLPLAAGPDQDWGDLTLHDSSEDYGTIAAFHDEADDWNLLSPEIGPVEDWGDLAVVTASDDWGDLAVGNLVEDWSG